VDLDLQGKRAVVAAGSAGLGLAVARALRAEGARVAICGRRKDVLDASARELDAIGLVADLAEPRDARAFVDTAAGVMGGVDILVLNSGGPPALTFGTSSMPDYEAALQSNLLASIAMCESAVPAMKQAGWGRILAITSLAAREPRPGNIMTGMARAGLTAFLKALSLELAPHGITVNSLQPGPHDTDRLQALKGSGIESVVAGIPVKAVGRPEDFGQVAAFLCSAQARFITGSSIPVDGGLYPGLY
jgi:3-oxoacyl-[acyl-carrier protein] reductase